ncbi:MAG: carboxypeptidase regulatory-like domain-containing protein, partial [Methanothrix sp.]
MTTSSLAAVRQATFYSHIDNRTVDWPAGQNHTFPYFDPEMGRLIRIDFMATLNSSMNGTTENRNNQSGVRMSYLQDFTDLAVKMINGDWLNLTVNLSVPETGSVSLEPFTLPIWSGNDTLSGYDYGDTHGWINYTAQGDLAGYIGTGYFNLSATATATTSVTGGGNQVSDLRTFGWSNATITYTYDDSRCISGYKLDRCTGLPLSGWKIILNNSTQEWNATTDANGFWRVCSLENDTYTVCEAPRSGWTQISPAACHTVTLAGINITKINFSNQELYCISGYKLDACNGQPLAGWNITLKNATHTVNDTTGPDGKYEFCNLKPGSYTITEEVRAGYNAVTKPSNPVMLNCSNVTYQNFTNQRLYCISGYKIDACTNAGLPGWTVTLTNGSYSVNTSTNRTGFYQFCGLAPG